MLRTRWSESAHLPGGVAMALDALSFDGTGGSPGHLSDREWKAVLAWCDRFQLTLVLGNVLRLRIPSWVREAIDDRLAKNRLRNGRIVAAWQHISALLLREGIEPVVLKGFTHWQDYLPSPELRVQYDVDLYAPSDAHQAQGVLRAHGYVPVRSGGGIVPDHLSPLRMPSVWRWTGDYFDPAIPLSIEIHTRLWNPGAEGLEAPGIQAFWARRTLRRLDECEYFALDRADGLAYAALHALRHVLRGEPRPAHFYELAWLLDARAGDDPFWTRRHALHEPALRRLSAVALALASAWFGPSLHPVVQAEIAALSGPLWNWIAACGRSPIEAYFHPNKDEIGLHLALAGGGLAGLRFSARRLIPVRAGRPPVLAVERSMAFGERVRRHIRFGLYACRRASFHARALAATASTMLRMRSW